MCKQEQTKGLTVPRNGYISTSSQASNKLGRFFPSSIKNEPVVTPAGIGNKIVHEADHPKKLEFEELEKNLSFLEPAQPVHDEIPRDNPSSSYKRSIVEPKMRTGALRIRAINAPPSPLRRPNRSHTHSDNPRRASLRPSTLYRELKRNEYYWF